jgi:ribosomal protein L31
VHILDRKIECYDAFAQVYTGRVEGKTTIDLSDFDHPLYTGAFQAENIEADDFVSRFTPFGGHLFGKCNLTKATYSAVGWEPEAFLNSLTLNGDMDVREGRVVTSGPLADGFSQLATYAKRPFKEEQTLRDLTSKISVAGGRVMLEEIVGDLEGLGAMSVKGSYGFDNTLDYAGAILLDETNRRKLGFAGQELALPVSISGTIMKPNVKFDFSELARKVAEDAAKSEVDKLKDKAKDALNGLFKK